MELPETVKAGEREEAMYWAWQSKSYFAIGTEMSTWGIIKFVHCTT